MPAKKVATLAAQLAFENRHRILAQCLRTWKRVWRRIKRKGGDECES